MILKGVLLKKGAKKMNRIKDTSQAVFVSILMTLTVLYMAGCGRVCFDCGSDVDDRSEYDYQKDLVVF